MYYCELCDYKTKNRNNIEIHHIVPKELNGSNKKSNKVYVCGTCHSKIYVNGSKSGAHSIKNTSSIVINGWFYSTTGAMLLIEKDGKEEWLVRKN